MKANFTVPPELYYTPNHEWASVDENVVTVGLTGYRLNEIGEVLYLDLPEDGKTVRQDEAFSTIEGVKVVHDFLSPVTGTVIEVNQALIEDPGVLNDDPLNQGWLVKIEMDSEKELAKLIRAPEYRKLINLSPGSTEEMLDDADGDFPKSTSPKQNLAGLSDDEDDADDDDDDDEA